MGRLRGFFWLTAGLVVAVLAGFVAFVTLARAQADTLDQPASVPEVSVVIAASNIGVRQALGGQDLELRSMPVSSVPEGAARRVEDVEGQLTLVDLYPGEVVLVQRLVEPNVVTNDARAALALAEDEVLMAFPRDDLMTEVNILKAGDQVDLLFTLNIPVDPDVVGPNQGTTVDGTAVFGGNVVEDNDTQVTFGLLQNMVISAVVAANPADDNDLTTPAGGADAIMLTLAPQDALVLKYVKDAGGVVDLVLRAPGSDRQFDVQPVDLDYLIDRYRIPVR